MFDRTVKCALWLRQEGIKANDVVTVCSSNIMNSFTLIYVSFSLAVIFTPWNTAIDIRMTEVCGSITIQMPYHKLESVGMVSKNVQIKIIDIETENTLRPNKIGWFHSGDLTYYDEKGQFFFVDRLKETIKYKGYLIILSLLLPKYLVTERELSELIAKNMTKCNHLRVGVLFLEKMPYTPSEKISRKKLKAIAKSHFCK
uniref:Luciferase n=1 Tax=Vespula pensylvanica TaxID=30213 RepID=A0A834NIR9_VESPE|nr:hypothetical protein H0235_014191 [Vespula pensylvanica]